MTPEIYAGLPNKVTILFNKSRLNEKKSSKYLIIGNRKHRYLMNEDLFNLVCDEVAKFYELNLDQLVHYKSRRKQYQMPRKMCYVLIYELHLYKDYDINITSIGYRFNKRTHATILSAKNKMVDWIESEKGLNMEYNTIKKEIIKKLEK